MNDKPTVTVSPDKLKAAEAVIAEIRKFRPTSLIHSGNPGQTGTIRGVDYRMDSAGAFRRLTPKSNKHTRRLAKITADGPLADRYRELQTA